MNLSIKNITKVYGNTVRALDHVSLEIPPGMYGLLGPNGAGKSTLMRTLATLQDPDEGEVYLGKFDLIKQKDEVRSILGYLPQDFGLMKGISSEKLLDHFAVLKGISGKSGRKDIVEHLLKQVNLWDKRRYRVDGFSGGMKQRFGIAIALLGNPRLLIVDEPTAGLDPSERLRFLNLLGELGENSIVILSTHIVDDVSELCTNMGIIHKGQILLETIPLLAMESLKGKIWQKITDRIDLLRLEKEHTVISTRLLSGRILVHVYSDYLPEQDFILVEPDLKDVYFSVMAGCKIQTGKEMTS